MKCLQQQRAARLQRPQLPRAMARPRHAVRCPRAQAAPAAPPPPSAALLLPGPTPTGWQSLAQPLLWEGTEADASAPGAPTFQRLSAPWRMMLLSCGSVTRHLEVMSGGRMRVECLQMQELGDGTGLAGLPPEVALLPGPYLQRQVLLHAPAAHSRPMVYSASWWNAGEAGAALRDASTPIWASLTQGRGELYREILTVSHGGNAALEEYFQEGGPFWGRYYLFWRGGRPVTLIYEAFSPALELLLGPQQPQRGAARKAPAGASSSVVPAGGLLQGLRAAS